MWMIPFKSSSVKLIKDSAVPTKRKKKKVEDERMKARSKKVPTNLVWQSGKPTEGQRQVSHLSGVSEGLRNGGGR